MYVPSESPSKKKPSSSTLHVPTYIPLELTTLHCAPNGALIDIAPLEGLVETTISYSASVLFLSTLTISLSDVCAFADIPPTKARNRRKFFMLDCLTVLLV